MKNSIKKIVLFLAVSLFFLSCNKNENSDNRYIKNKDRAEKILKKYNLSENDENINISKRQFDRDITEEEWIHFDKLASTFKVDTKKWKAFNYHLDKLQQYLFENKTLDNKLNYMNLHNELNNYNSVCELFNVAKNHRDKFPDEMMNELRESCNKNEH